MKYLLNWILLCAFLIGTSCHAFESTQQLTGSLVSVRPSLLGGEFYGTVLVRPTPTRNLLVGPRIGVMWAGGSTDSRLEVRWGVEGTLWGLNAIGLGLGIDAVAPSFSHSKLNESTTSESIHFRLNPFLSTRFLRFGSEGAWAFRLGAAYDALFQWGAQVGVSVQLGGVP
jgi:hypothetical protein